MEIIESLTRDAIINLVHDSGQAAPHVTIYAPTHRAGAPPNMTEDQIRLKNLVHAACAMLKERPDGQATCEMLSAKLVELETDMHFWENQTEGLLICAHGTKLHMFHLPINTEEYAAVDDQYHLAAAMALVNDAHSYYVLTVGQQHPSLYTGDSFDLRATDLKLPDSIENGLNLDEPNQKTEQQRSDGGTGSSAGTVNGRGGARDAREQDRQRFWRLIDQKVMAFANTKLPLILAGTGSEIAEYRSISNYPNIIADCIEGSFNGLAPHDLFIPAAKIIDHNITDVEHSAAVEEYSRLAGANPDRTAATPQTIDDAAEAGRIETLLLGIHRTTTDTVRDDMMAVPTISFPGTVEQEALHSRIAQQVFNTSGRVLAIEQSDMPEHAQMLARLRY